MKTRFMFSIIVIMMAVLFTGSCNKEPDPGLPQENTEEVEKNIALLKTTAVNIEKALTDGNQQTFLSFVNPAYLKYYQTAVQSNAAKLTGFAEVFKTRKLITCNGYFAVYQVTYNGKSFEITMVLDDEGNWKLKDM